MLKTAPDIRPDARAVLELPLAAMADYPGTVAVIDRYGTPSIAIGTASLVEVLQAAGRWPELVAASARVMVNGVAAIVVLADGPDNPIEATLLPLSGTQVLALLRPLDFEKALLRSLVESRQRYKDLIEIVSDFTWETDDEGCFTFISPRGALDWPASELVGRPVAEFLAGAGETPEPPPVFRARSAVEDGDVWFRRADGTSDCLSVAAVPLVDAAGTWRGARGACRRVTEQRQRERDAAHGHLRDRLVTHLSRTIGDEIDPQNALAAAASATGLALSASGAAVWRGDRAEALVIAARWGSSAESPILKLHEMAQTLSSTGAVELESDDLYLIGGVTRFHGGRNGAAIFWRARDHGPFTAEDRIILDAVADPFGVAIALLARHETTLALARTDPLTGLLNRRGFSEEVARRMARLLREAQPACLVYMDLDNFKLVNDTHGHEAGDAALIALSRILRESTRAGDLIARLGGDEFVMWLDGIGDAVVERRAETLIAACRPLAALSGDPERPLGVSLGLAVYDPAYAETPEALLARADGAMYRAKQQGKGSFAIAVPPDDAP
jgi:diguanylate cyclase (GGDEF)-like protein/PAS domain S-box-containing protein